MKHRFGQLEYHVVDSCNFSCKFCAHYSDFHNSKKRVSVKEAVAEWSLWSHRVIPDVFWILGGEPTLHSDLCSLVVAAKIVWKDSRIGVGTNGTLLGRHYAIGQLMLGNRVAVSLHGTKEEEILKTVSGLGVDVELRRSHDNWTQWYQIVDGVPRPFDDGNQRESWVNCNANQCKILRDGSLWKCPQVALAGSVGIDWFSDYEPLGHDCSDESLLQWLSMEDEACCGRCPSCPTSRSSSVQK